MEERTVDDKSSRTSPVGSHKNHSRFWLCVERLKSGSLQLWVLCLTSWILLFVYRYRLVHVEDRLSVLEYRFDTLGMNLNPSSSMDHLHTYVKSVIRQVSIYDALSLLACTSVNFNC
ncbi:uncharacterized protein CEXT_330941 [Caerostris extrusa]|uniref:Uncharacterized protein n=1 Tax=Caerostris extrusa TaxID=172846 RepID=A0AAV4XLI1_CAEEX|nr:uncharacterized protein CEXT_330941 [Caerostris extrusa]